jgi:hypothetical protein
MAADHWGVARSGLEARARDVEAADPALLALARVLADHVDRLDAQIRTMDEPPPYSRIPLATLAQRYGELLDRLFPREVPGGDPLADLVLSLSADADSQA